LINNTLIPISKEFKEFIISAMNSWGCGSFHKRWYCLGVH
jgi:hypothetical protein